MVFELKNPKEAEKLFAGCQDTMVWSCLSGIMGRIYGDSPENPRSAKAMLADFCFFAGEPEREVVSFEPEGKKKGFLILVPGSEGWEKAIRQVYGKSARQRSRYATKKEPDIFDKKKLAKAAASLPAGYVLTEIDSRLFYKCREISWCKDFVAQYEDYGRFEKYGMGAVVLKDGEIVSGASSYSGYGNGIEIQIETREDFRRKGLAYAAGAQLILNCMERGWYPSWDAHTLESLSLAKKLGYRLDREYTVYEIGEETLVYKEE